MISPHDGIATENGKLQYTKMETWCKNKIEEDRKETEYE